MEEIDLRKYLSKLPAHELGRIRYNPVNMLKTVLFGFMDEGCISLRKMEDNCKVNIRYKYLMDGKCPSYRTFGYFINTVLMNQAESLFYEITFLLGQPVYGFRSVNVNEKVYMTVNS